MMQIPLIRDISLPLKCSSKNEVVRWEKVGLMGELPNLLVDLGKMSKTTFGQGNAYVQR
jgi:hypothetical protein